MNIKSLLFKDKVLISAILFSAVWHIFWLSAFTVVTVPKIKKPVKFSSVSFLGPILDRGILNVNVKEREQTILEKKYFASVVNGPDFLRGEGIARDSYVLSVFDEALSYGDDGELAALIAVRIDTDKIEPGRDVD